MNNGSDLDGIVTVEEEVVGTDDTADRVEVSLTRGAAGTRRSSAMQGSAVH